MTPDTDTDTALEALFADARAEAPAPLSPEFAARLTSAAVRAMPRPQPTGIVAWVGALLAGVGGLPGLASLSAAGVAGLWIGVAQPGATDVLGMVLPATLTGAEASAFTFAEAGDLLSLMGDASE